MDSGTSILMLEYSSCLERLRFLLKNMEMSLERYSEKDSASEFYLDQENNKMEAIADFVNISEQLLDYQAENFVSRQEHEAEIRGIHAKYELVFDPEFWTRVETFWDDINAGKINSPIIQKMKWLRA